MSISLYVGTYAKYNNGSIQGAWIELEGHDQESFYEACAELHADEADPEYMFQDCEDVPSWLYSESSASNMLFGYANASESEREIVDAFVDCFGTPSEEDFDDLLAKAEGAYQGQYENDVDFAEDYIEQTGMLHDVPDTLKNYFDYQAFARDLMYDFSTSNGHYFNSNW